MGKPKAEDIVKEVGANLDSWYKKNADRIKLMGDLTLDCQACKTKDAKDLIGKDIDLKLKSLQTDLMKLNKDNSALFKDVEKAEKQDIGKKVKETVEKKMTMYNKDGKTLVFDPKYEDGVPSIGVKGTF